MLAAVPLTRKQATFVPSKIQKGSRAAKDWETWQEICKDLARVNKRPGCLLMDFIAMRYHGNEWEVKVANTILHRLKAIAKVDTEA